MNTKVMSFVAVPVLLLAAVAVAVFYLVTPAPKMPTSAQFTGNADAPAGAFDPEIGQVASNGYYATWTANGGGCTMNVADSSHMIFKQDSMDPCSPQGEKTFLQKFGDAVENARQTAQDLIAKIPNQ